MSDPINPQPPAVPDWAEQVLEAFDSAATWGAAPNGERLTKIEEDLLNACWVLLRARFGRSSIPNPQDSARFLIDRAVKTLAVEQAAAESPKEYAERFTPSFISDVFAVLDKHGFRAADRVHAGAAAGLLLDVVQCYEGREQLDEQEIRS